MTTGWIGPLRAMMVVLWAACVAGAVMTAAVTAGWVSLWMYVVSGLAGLAVGIPGGLWTARYLRREHGRPGRLA